MAELIDFPDGGLRFLKGGFPHSQGGRRRALPWRARFGRPVPVADGCAAIEAYLAALGRPRTALCAAELRSPRKLSMSGFAEFNTGYVAVLEQSGLFRNLPFLFTSSPVHPIILTSARGAMRWRRPRPQSRQSSAGLVQYVPAACLQPLR